MKDVQFLNTYMSFFPQAFKLSEAFFLKVKQYQPSHQVKWEIHLRGMHPKADATRRNGAGDIRATFDVHLNNQHLGTVSAVAQW